MTLLAGTVFQHNLSIIKILNCCTRRLVILALRIEMIFYPRILRIGANVIFTVVD